MMTRAMPRSVAASQSFGDAASYDRFMGRWSRMLAPAFVEFASPETAETALDIGCGTGALVDALAVRLPGCRITGIDLSTSLVDWCRERFPPPRYRFEHADAAALPFADATFGTTLSLLVLMLLDDPGRAVAEMKRVTRPGGTVAACTWDADQMEMISMVWQEVRALDGSAPHQTGRTHCAHPGALQSLWTTTGLRDVRETTIALTLRYDTFEDLWEPLAAGVGPAGAYVALAPEPIRARLQERLRRRVTAATRDGGFVLSARALAVRGSVP